MGKSERKSISKNVRRKDKGITTEGMRRHGEPPRSERKWWKKGYSGKYQPPEEYWNNLKRYTERKEAERRKTE